jgi:S1-C subfamily serine protease
VGLEPPPAPAVGLPDQDQAREIGAAAIGSSVRFQSQACDRLLIGSGFAVRPDYVITNAHVVAGAEQTTVELDASGARSPADVVFFDPQLDVALLHVPGLNVPGLPFAVSAPDRGTLAAALGHPQGAQLTIVPAAVTAEIRARGRDLYGRDIVVRSIIELRSSIQPGDSGGPLVLPDGTVGGVIFADSRSDPEVGYALDPTAVAVDIQPAVGGATAVPVGPCLP